MKLIDTHVDTLTTIMDKGEELYSNTSHIDIKKLKKFDNTAIFFAIWLNKKRLENPFEETIKVIDFYFQQLEKNKDHISHSNNYDDLISNWENGKISSLLTLEGSEALAGNMENLQSFYDKGVRSITITWNNTNEAGNGALSKSNQGLTLFGKELIKNCNNLNILIDVSHINEKGFYDIISTTSKPIIATHSNAYEICNNLRNLTDHQLLELKNTNSIVGLNFHAPFVNGKKDYTYDDLLKHLDHMMSIIGEDKICIGSDFDGTDILPCNLSNILDDFPLYYFVEKAYNNSIANKIFYENQLNFIKQNL